eukprot:tig00021621_g22987.t1
MTASGSAEQSAPVSFRPVAAAAGLEPSLPLLKGQISSSSNSYNTVQSWSIDEAAAPALAEPKLRRPETRARAETLDSVASDALCSSAHSSAGSDKAAAPDVEIDGAAVIRVDTPEPEEVARPPLVTAFGHHLLRPLVLFFSWLNLFPVFYRTSRISIVGFGVFSGAACLLGVPFFFFFLRNKGFAMSGWEMYLPVYLSVANWFGARLFHLLSLGRAKFFSNPRKYLLETGFYVQGGITGIIVAISVYSAFSPVPVFVMFDAAAFAGLLILFIGRLGCYNYGCCYGRPTEVSWGVSYTNTDCAVLRGKPHLRGVRLHATQLYTAYADLAAFCVAAALVGRVPDGFLGCSFVLFHGGLRMFMENFRDDVTFAEGKNYFTQYVATAYFGTGVVGTLALVGSGFFARAPIPAASTVAGFLPWLAAEPRFAGVAALTGLLMFLGYGIHSSTLGSFVARRPKAPAAPEGPAPAQSA